MEKHEVDAFMLDVVYSEGEELRDFDDVVAAIHRLESDLLHSFHYWLRDSFCGSSFAFDNFIGELSSVQGLQIF